MRENMRYAHYWQICARTDVHNDCHTAKPLRRAKQYYDSGNVTKMQDRRQGQFYFVKANVLCSMKQSAYNVTVVLSVQSGFVRSATCECKSSALAWCTCSHVGAVLYVIDMCLRGNQTAGGTVPRTSLPCSWNVGTKQGKNPKKSQKPSMY